VDQGHRRIGGRERTVSNDELQLSLTQEEETAMSFTVVGKRYYLWRSGSSVNLRSNALNANVAVGFHFEPKPQTPDETLERQVVRRAGQVLHAAACALAESAASHEDEAAEDIVAIEC
jgi:hypothetical protein